jgi:hypothetical protein
MWLVAEEDMRRLRYVTMSLPSIGSYIYDPIAIILGMTRYYQSVVMGWLRYPYSLALLPHRMVMDVRHEVGQLLRYLPSLCRLKVEMPHRPDGFRHFHLDLKFAADLVEQLPNLELLISPADTGTIRWRPLPLPDDGAVIMPPVLPTRYRHCIDGAPASPTRPLDARSLTGSLPSSAPPPPSTRCSSCRRAAATEGLTPIETLGACTRLSGRDWDGFPRTEPGNYRD